MLFHVDAVHLGERLGKVKDGLVPLALEDDVALVHHQSFRDQILSAWNQDGASARVGDSADRSPERIAAIRLAIADGTKVQHVCGKGRFRVRGSLFVRVPTK